MEAGADAEDTQQLLAQLRAGKSSAFDELFKRYRGYLCRVVAMRLDDRIRHRVDVSDIVQEAQLAASKRMNEYLDREPMPFRLWLRKTAQECLLKVRRRHLRTQRRTVECEVRLPDRTSLQLAQRLIGSGTTPSEQLGRDERARLIRQAVAQLPESELEVVLLLNVEGLSSREAAYILDVDRSTVNRRHGQAIMRLEKILRTGGLSESQL